ncbi:alkyl sulfatase dimerization domain-containing protein [Endozoicomonas numazuensis]|uniref:alkyl sulfatase dimerization domain-containing protein n=1 Tax=Endozoicomonas numazuensis TaxID=1137799 RepID=UPI0009E04EB1|nr:alkyl sulfatase dimerization domain-containing protein [Endozoicomonas numazuensis]
MVLWEERSREATPYPDFYTHNHADHILGGRGFVPDGDIDVYAHESTDSYINRVINKLRPIITDRSSRMFGNQLVKGDLGLVNAGIGPVLNAGHGGGTPTLIRPNKTFSETLKVTVSGVKIRLIHAPGETNDQLFVYLPDKQVVMPGDNIYKAFPNLYTIRGTLYRDPVAWAKSLDKMRDLNPQYLVPSHTRPISGRNEVAGVLTAYRDAIQFVHDQTLRGMNKGMTEDQLVESVKLPEQLVEHPYLQEFYGSVEWSVRSIFNGYLGWFDGDAATLSRATEEERGKGMLDLLGEEKLLSAAREAIDRDQNRWALELVNYQLFVEPDHTEAKALKAEAMRNIAHATINPNGRNYYLSQAQELEGSSPEVKELDEATLELLKTFPASNFVEAMTVALDTEKSQGIDKRLSFDFTDVNEQFTLHVRNSIAEFKQEDDPDAEIRIAVTKGDWIELVTGKKGFAGSLAKGDLSVEGGVTSLPSLIGFLSMFDPVK